MSRKSPLVTGVSPRNGPPGTKVIIRGENLGQNSDDFVYLSVCGINCFYSASWNSSSKIVTYVGRPADGAAQVVGKIIVATTSGGVGESTVEFTMTPLQLPYHDGLKMDWAVWVDDLQLGWPTYHQAADGAAKSSTSTSLGLFDNVQKQVEQLAVKRSVRAPLDELFPQGAGNPNMDTFVPECYMLERLGGLSFQQLKELLAGLQKEARAAQLQAAAKTPKENQPQMFKEHLLAYRTTAQTLRAVQSTIADSAANQVDVFGSVGHLQESLGRTKTLSDRLFNTVLDRKERGDSIRVGYNAVNRFSLLFSLPKTMDENIAREEFDQVITDYHRAKVQLKDCTNEVFVQIQTSVEQKVAKLRQDLYAKLMTLPNQTDNQKKLIRYLNELDYAGDAAWECVSKQYEWIENEMLAIMQRHVSGKAASESRPEPPRVLFAKELCEFVARSVAQFWSLGQAYFLGTVLIEETGQSSKQINTGKHREFKNTCKQLMITLDRLVRSAFLEDYLPAMSDDERRRYGRWPAQTPGAWQPHCVKMLRGCIGSTCSLGNLFSDCVDLLKALAADLRVDCVTRLLRQAIADVQALVAKENWLLEPNDAHGATTQLPVMFENICTEAFDNLSLVVTKSRNAIVDSDLFVDSTIRGDVVKLVGNLLQSFAAVLETVAKQKVDPPIKLVGLGVSELTRDIQVLASWTNCSYTKRIVLPRIMSMISKSGFPIVDSVQQATTQRFDAVERRLSSAYMEAKTGSLVGGIEQQISVGWFDYSHCAWPLDVRNYLKDVVLQVINVHAEVTAICPALTRLVVEHVVEETASELVRLMECVSNFCNEGALQARIDFRCFELAVAPFLTDKAARAIARMQQKLARNDTDAEEQLNDVAKQFERNMKLQLLCFTS